MVNNIWSNLTVHHAKSQISPINNYLRMENEVGPVEYRTIFINNTFLDITVIDRSGFRHTVRPKNISGEHKFIIRTEIRVRNECIREIKKFLSTIDTRFNSDITLIKQIMLSEDCNTFNGYTIFLDHTLCVEEIKQKGGSVYCKPKDIVISLGNIYNAPPHPYAEDSIHDYLLDEKISNQDLGSPAFRIEIVDNNNQISSRFIFAFGELHEIKPKLDINRESGVYLTLMEANSIFDRGYSVVQKKYTFEEAKEKLGLYKTREEASAAGDIQLIRKEELTRLAHANEVLKQETIEIKANIEKETAERDRQFNKEKAELEEKIIKLKAEKEEIEHFREQERNARKDDYERKSHERKDYSELIKFLPFVVITIGALVAAFNKSGNSK